MRALPSAFSAMRAILRDALCVVQLDVPVEIIAPALGSVAEADRNANGRGRVRTLRRAQQMHGGLGRRTSPLAPVACDAARHDVLPVFSAALGDRHHMIEGQLA